jgi:ferritin-like metal-binding protein YciE
MPTLTPTKATGSVAKASPALYVEPAQVVTDESLTEELAVDGVNAAFMADLLSAYLTHERCGTHLYRSVAGRTNNPVLKERYEDFGRETLRHVEVLEEVIAALGGNPSYVSPMARAVEASDGKALESTFLADGGLDPMTREMAMLDAVFMAEAVDRANWEALALIAPTVGDGAVRQALDAAVAEVLPQEDDHHSWAHDTRARLTMIQLSSSGAAEVGITAEVLVAQVRDWFSGDGAEVARPSPRKAVAKKAPAKKAVAKKAPAKKAPATRAMAKKAVAKKASAKRAPARKATTKRAPAKKATSRAGRR